MNGSFGSFILPSGVNCMFGRKIAAKPEKAGMPREKGNPSHSPRELPLQRSVHPAMIVQRARAHPQSLTRSDFMVLQRCVGNRAVCQLMNGQSEEQKDNRTGNDMSQAVTFPSLNEMWSAVAPDVKVGEILGNIKKIPDLEEAYEDIEKYFEHMKFQYITGDSKNKQFGASSIKIDDNNEELVIEYANRDEMNSKYRGKDQFVGGILHEMMHIVSALQYKNYGSPGTDERFFTMHLPEFEEPKEERMIEHVRKQIFTMRENWGILRDEMKQDISEGKLSKEQVDTLNDRIEYAMNSTPAHYDVVLVEILYYMAAQGLVNTRTYQLATKMLHEANLRRRDKSRVNVEIMKREPLPVPSVERGPMKNSWCQIL